MSNQVELLLIEDNPADVRLVEIAIKNSGRNIHVHAMGDGESALSYLRERNEYGMPKHPHLILLDLNLPRKNGKEILKEIKNDENLRHIPVVILTSSQDKNDITQSYDLCANCFVCKPSEWDQFMSTMDELTKFWLDVAKIP